MASQAESATPRLQSGDDMSVATAHQDNKTGDAIPPVKCMKQKPVPAHPSNPAKRYHARFSFSATVVASDNATDARIKAAKIIHSGIQAIFAADSKACLYPWKETNKVDNPGITKDLIHKIENYDVRQLRDIYINRGFLATGSSFCGFAMHIGFEHKEAKFKKTFARALREHGISLYSHHPYEETVQIGYLKGSVRALDPQRIIDAIYADSGVEVVGRFRPVAKHTTDDTEVLVRAFVIEAASPHYGHADRQYVQALFQSDSDQANEVKKLCAMPLKLICPEHKVSAKNKAEWWEHLHEQQDFSDLTAQKQVYKVFTKALHRQILGDLTIRDLIQAVHIPGTTKPLFISVDQASTAAVPTVTYLKKHSAAVEHFLDGVAITLLHILPEEFREDSALFQRFSSCFTAVEMDKFEGQKWDPQEGTFFSMDEILMRDVSNKFYLDNIDAVFTDTRKLLQAQAAVALGMSTETIDGSTVGTRSLATNTAAASTVLPDQFSLIAADDHSIDLTIESEDDKNDNAKIQDDDNESKSTNSAFHDARAGNTPPTLGVPTFVATDAPPDVAVPQATHPSPFSAVAGLTTPVSDNQQTGASSGGAGVG